MGGRIIEIDVGKKVVNNCFFNIRVNYYRLVILKLLFYF